MGNSEEGKWWRRECGDDGKWWLRELVTKGVWWLGEVVTKGVSWLWEVVTKGSGDEGNAAKYIVLAAWMLHGLCFGEEAGVRNLVFLRVKWLQLKMKVPRVCGRCGCGRFMRELVSSYWSSVFCNEWLFHVVPVCVVLCVSWISGCRSHWNGCMIVVMLCCHVRREMRVSHVMPRNAL